MNPVPLPARLRRLAQALRAGRPTPDLICLIEAAATALESCMDYDDLPGDAPGGDNPEDGPYA